MSTAPSKSNLHWYLEISYELAYLGAKLFGLDKRAIDVMDTGKKNHGYPPRGEN